MVVYIQLPGARVGGGVGVPVGVVQVVEEICHVPLSAAQDASPEPVEVVLFLQVVAALAQYPQFSKCIQSHNDEIA